MINDRGREIPAHIDGYGETTPYREGEGTSAGTAGHAATHFHVARPDASKLLRSIDAALAACDVRDGATLSFHHHLRNGDQVLNLVLAAAATRGLRDLRIAASSLFGTHAPLIDHIRNGVVTRIVTAYAAGPVADAISRGELPTPVVMQTHGGRARDIESGKLAIDVAFIGAPTADDYGNINGVQGPAACGTLGYAMVDAQYARRVVAITDHLVPYPACPADITQDCVDFVVTVPSIGDAQGILSGTTRPTTDPVGLQIAETAARVIEASGLLREGFSFQTGAGGVSLAVAAYVAEAMRRDSVQGSFGAGGVTGYLVDMLEAGLFRSIWDVQCFDLKAVDSYRRDPRHQCMSASLYANPHHRGAVANRLDTMILGAAEIDLDFNVNVTTGSTGRILGGSGGHSDTAAGAKLALVTTRLAAGGVPKIVERVTCLTTPGSTIDAVVTEAGVAVNPARGDLAERVRAAGLPLVTIEALRGAARDGAGPAVTRPDGRIVAVVEYRDGTVIDVVQASG